MSNIIRTIYPFTGEILKEYKRFTEEQVIETINKSAEIFQTWKSISLDKRINKLNNLKKTLEEQKEQCANFITHEMGKPYKESIAEIEKCIWLIEFYKENAIQFLSDDIIKTEAQESFISYDPMGVILAIMPWNYPFWQVLRFAIPTLTAGNTVLVKHADNVTGCALAIQRVFETAGYQEGCFQTVLVSHKQVRSIIENKNIKAVTLTGSEKAGKAISKITGEHLKKTVLELGGNNACIIWEDADLDKYIKTIVNARMQNAGQSCIAAKRFIIVEEIYDEFVEKFKSELQKLRFGAPTDPKTEISTLAKEDFVKELQEQINESLKMGAKVVIGNKYKKAFFEPTIIENVTPGMPVFDEEVFGPVAAFTKAEDREHSIQLASQSKFGLGTMLFTEDIENARKQIDKIEDGAFFINEMVKSDPRLPFGGTKNSGYGRELSKEGILEFVNKKTVYVR
ncbi:NAD-dependent succinate-semialdehyde dehydrogenase [Aquimarina algicola]|uniref:NAD-dependent succinate-semialdehyde dehydrogenase n=1 Tax=Aquimarina algicola TaxID=2589995 RepID=A0A504J987_9FLAO|nr:NAD-dependent succinate-semialdehyde dehydrogenase [Aquimarina algicola]TPN84438.1 NAD-dependent succinate-semialdehyde dehydrogenase [Aquimarina algicola]